jgi:hypothetical protein
MGHEGEPDEGGEQLLGEMLENMRGMVRVYTSRLQDRVEELEVEVESQLDRVAQLRWQGEKDRMLLKDLRVLVWKMPRPGMDADVVAKIRGLLHG